MDHVQHIAMLAATLEAGDRKDPSYELPTVAYYVTRALEIQTAAVAAVKVHPGGVLSVDRTA